MKRAAMFRAGKSWQPFLNLLNRQDKFIQHMAARIIAKLAVYYTEVPMEKGDLHFYLSWLVEQLKKQVSKFSLFHFLAHVQCVYA